MLIEGVQLHSEADALAGPRTHPTPSFDARDATILQWGKPWKSIQTVTPKTKH